MSEERRYLKLHLIVLVLVVLAELIGIKSYKLGPGTLVLLPMLYALLMGILTGPKFLKIVNMEDMKAAEPLITVSVLLLMAKYGTNIGPTLPLIIKSGPALILQEFGNIGTVFLGLPFALLLGLRREAIGATFSIAREPNIAIISDMYGLDSAEGRGVMGVYMAGTVFGSIFFGLFAGFAATSLPLHPYALAMASGVGSASMMSAAVGALTEIFPAMAEEITALGAASNLASGADGVYMSLFIALPMCEWLYRKIIGNRMEEVVK
ncbi:MAG: DUF3100 domain-containing protein [Tepidanaerobacteraceae bacterium]|nr:DUF3100 domain-containing protein [Tepidanaerobacteraceae bacterium]